MHPAARLQLERMIGEYARWRGVPEKERSPAPAWWWGQAIELSSSLQPLPSEWCAALALPDPSTYRAAAQVFLRAFATQTSLPWPDDFPRIFHHPDAAARELHPQPSDDSAFQA